MLKTFGYQMINIDIYNSGYYISQLESVTWSFVKLYWRFFKVPLSFPMWYFYTAFIQYKNIAKRLFRHRHSLISGQTHRHRCIHWNKFKRQPPGRYIFRHIKQTKIEHGTCSGGFKSGTLLNKWLQECFMP